MSSRDHGAMDLCVGDGVHAKGLVLRPRPQPLRRYVRQRMPVAKADASSAQPNCALMARPSMRRALALVGIARSFTAFDAKRGFEVMQTAVKEINEVLAQREASKPGRSNPGAAGEFEAGELYGSGYEAAFAALGRADFKRARSLAEQFTARDISVLAQLAVCRGGLARP